jgi:hypothetical protein
MSESIEKRCRRLIDGGRVSFTPEELRSGLISFGERCLHCTVCGVHGHNDLAVLMADGWTWDWPNLFSARCWNHTKEKHKAEGGES